MKISEAAAIIKEGYPDNRFPNKYCKKTQIAYKMALAALGMIEYFSDDIPGLYDGKQIQAKFNEFMNWEAGL